MDTTPWRVVQVAAGWAAGVGTLLSVLTAAELAQGWVARPVIFIGLTLVAWALFWWAGRNVNERRRHNIHYLAEHSAAPILARRRRIEKSAVWVRGWALGVFLTLASAFIVLLTIVSCKDEECSSADAVPEPAMVLFQSATLAAGAVFGASASFVRVYRDETDDTELKALQNYRSDDDGTPGLSGSKWE